MVNGLASKTVRSVAVRACVKLYQEGLERGRSFSKTVHLGENRA